MDTQNTSITSHLEGFLLTARKMEDELGQEKQKNQTLTQEYLSIRTKLENGVRELQTRLLQRENKIQAISEAYRNLQANESKIKKDLLESNEREKKLAIELNQYKSAWNEVLARESQARGALIEFEKAKRLLNEQRNHIVDLEKSLKESNSSNQSTLRVSETYQKELQSALVRLQSTESQFSQLEKELSAVNQAKRNADEEISRIESNMKERFRWELATEKEMIRADLEKESALERERFREASRNQMRNELEKIVMADKASRDILVSEMNQTVQELLSSRDKIKGLDGNVEILREENRTLKQLRSSADQKMGITQSELAMTQMELNQLKIQFETMKKEANKIFLMERLSNESIISRHNQQVQQLLKEGFCLETLDSEPDGVSIIDAIPVNDIEFNRNKPMPMSIESVQAV